jgi:hypothetical protein
VKPSATNPRRKNKGFKVPLGVILRQISGLRKMPLHPTNPWAPNSRFGAGERRKFYRVPDIRPEIVASYEKYDATGGRDDK